MTRYDQNFKLVFFSDSKKVQDLIEVTKKLPKKSYFIFREYSLNQKEREDLARKLIKITRHNNIKFIVAQDIKLAKKIQADGIHFSDHKQLPQLFRCKKSFKKNFIFSYSCHSLKSAILIKKIGCDLSFISPIFKTTSHQDSRILGKIQFLKILGKNHNILPLGGINNKNIAFIKKSGALGFGAIDYFIR